MVLPNKRPFGLDPAPETGCYRHLSASATAVQPAAAEASAVLRAGAERSPVLVTIRSLDASQAELDTLRDVDVT